MDAVSEEASPTGDLDDLFASGRGSGTPAALGPNSGGPAEEVGELDDLFGPDLANLGAGGAAAGARPQAPGMVTNILQPEAESTDVGSLFGGGAVDPDKLFAPTGKTGLQGAVTAATLAAVDAGADADMDNLFGSGGIPSLDSAAEPGTDSNELQDIFTSPEPPPMATPDDDLDNLFADPGPTDAQPAVGADDLFGTGTPSAPPSPGGDMDDLFASTGAAPAPSGEDDLDDLFSGAGGGGGGGGGGLAFEEQPTSTGPVVDVAGSQGAGDLDDLFDSLDPSADGFSVEDFAPGGAETGDTRTVDLAADALFAGEGPAGAGDGGQFDDLFGSATMEPDVSMPQLTAPGPASAGGTIDVSASLGEIPPSQGAGDLDDLFAAPSSTDDPSVDSIDAHPPATGSLAGLPSDGYAADQVQSLMAESDDNAPGVPGLEAGDLLAEAHRVADAGGRQTYEEPEDRFAFMDEVQEEEAVAPRPSDRRKPRKKPRFYALPPEPGRLARLARLGGLLAASTLLAAAIRLHPEGAALPLPVLAPCVALASGVIGLFVYAATKIRVPMGVLSRGLALAAVGLVIGKVVTPASLAAGAEAWPMLLALGFSVGTVLELDVLYLSLRLSLAIVGVYSSMSLVMALVRETPYQELVIRRVLEAPKLAEHIPPDRVELALKAFDPLFVAANFFLPAVLVVTVLQALRDLTRRWWGMAFTRLATASIAGLAVYWNLQQFQQLEVPNLLTLAGLK
jgi:hypothetical protein